MANCPNNADAMSDDRGISPLTPM